MSKRQTATTSHTTRPQVEEMDSRAQFFIDQIIVEKNKTTMVLNTPKEGFTQIVFEFNERADLKSLLLSAFEGGKPFDFVIVEKLANKQCKINNIKRTFSVAASGADGRA